MSFSDEQLEDLYNLFEGVLEDRLTPGEAARLEHMVQDDPDARRLYVEYMHQHACLRWSGGMVDADEDEAGASGKARFQRLLSEAVRQEQSAEKDAAEAASAESRARTMLRGKTIQRISWMVSGAVMIIIGIVLGLTSFPWVQPGSGGTTVAENEDYIPQVRFVATLISAKSCKWESGTLPTEPGTRLPAGKLRLAEGLAWVTFDDGAIVSLEAPAEIELLTTGRCRFTRGKLMAEVPPQAVGFTVDTEMARIVDLGTEFGVHVTDKRETEVQVFTGEVKLEHYKTGELLRVAAGESKRATAEGIVDFNPLVAEEGKFDSPETKDERPTEQLYISTADGKGKDTYIEAGAAEDRGSEILLMVKATTSSTHRRKAYIGIDLGELKGREIVEARLTLTIEPTNLGFASGLPDSHFVVYGVTDESLDDWDENGLTYENAPANLPPAAEVDLAKATRLGTFMIPQGVRHGTRTVSGPALVKFLNDDTNNMATFIVVRRTFESKGASLVHGFASKDHPTADPPSLRLKVVEEP